MREALKHLAGEQALGAATADLFEQALDIPLQRIGDLPVPLSQLLGGHHHQTFDALVDKAYLCGLVDDAAFAGEESSGNAYESARAEAYEGMALFAVDLRERDGAAPPRRADLTLLVRAFNRSFHRHPVVLLFRYPTPDGPHIALATCERSAYVKETREGEKAGRIALLRDLDPLDPHAGHLRILNELRIPRKGPKAVTTFDGLYTRWMAVFDTDVLSRDFYRELSDWFFWACRECVFPGAPDRKDFDDDAAHANALHTHNATCVIRLVTRLLFTWFLKEKRLVPEALFDRAEIRDLLKNNADPSSYYKAVLQNLFFATFNQEPGDRGFRNPNSSNYVVTTLCRYQELFRDAERFLELQRGIPFLNCGLFECQDKPHPEKKNRNGNPLVVRLDGFSDRKDNPLLVPDELFWGEDRKLDLNAEYGDTRHKACTVRGLIPLLHSYKFTITENTPLEQDVALDPELLGKVFENLLAAYNPETRTTARKQTGSFYTPRLIVERMVVEGLAAHLDARLGEEAPFLEMDDFRERLTRLLEPGDAQPFEDSEGIRRLIEALSELKILDPACGSGAFPMGALQGMVHALAKLDPENGHWKQAQLRIIDQIPDSEIRESARERLEEAFAARSHDYGRKVYLIENGVYGVDLQPIAVQISQLRFYISLMVEQAVDPAADNLGVKPLPNLETKFVAANTLLGIEEQAQQGDFFQEDTEAVKRLGELREELTDVRHRHFGARTTRTKAKWREKDKELRAEMAGLLKRTGLSTLKSTQLAGWDPYDQNASADFFDPGWMFNLREGFDLVIGNPPYVRQEKIKDLKPALQRFYPRFTGTADLYVYFYDRAFQLLKPEVGVLSYITSNKYFRSGYGAKLREFLKKSTTLERLTDFGDAPVFTAIAYPSIIVALNRPPTREHELPALSWNPEEEINRYPEIFERDAFAITQRELDRNAWRIERPDVLALLEKIRNAGTPLGEYVKGRVYRGVLTGLNEAFVIDGDTRQRLITEDPACEDIIKPFLRGRDVKRWKAEFAEKYLIKIESSENKQHPWTKKPPKEAEEIFKQTWPSIWSWFQSFREGLIKRCDQGKYFWELRSCDYWEEFEKPKIFYPDIYEHQSFAYDEKGYFGANTCYFIAGVEPWLTAILNSKLMEWYYSSLCNRIRGGYLRAFSVYMEQLPIIAPDKSTANQLTAYMETLVLADNPDKSKKHEYKIIEDVYRLYDLTPREIELIEEGT